MYNDVLTLEAESNDESEPTAKPYKSNVTFGDKACVILGPDDQFFIGSLATSP